MKRLTFLQVLESNIKCAMCENKECPVRYYPERKKIQYCNGTRYTIMCEKDREDYIKKSLKRHLP